MATATITLEGRANGTVAIKTNIPDQLKKAAIEDLTLEELALLNVLIRIHKGLSQDEESPSEVLQ